MKKSTAALLMFMLMITLAACKKEKKLEEPHYVLVKWARAIQDLNYQRYAECEAYPKSEGVFREMFRDYYYTDMMTTAIDQPDKKDIRTDFEDNPYIHTPVSFEAGVVKRGSGKPYQVVRGDAVFMHFTEGRRSRQGWLISNRTMVTVNR